MDVLSITVGFCILDRFTIWKSCQITCTQFFFVVFFPLREIEKRKNGNKLVLSHTASGNQGTLFCLEDKLLCGCSDDIISMLQSNTVIPSNCVQNA
ncbi:unnamed protein product, partial [Vitis vinifera]|uniref:Uncharacterized protein n=1 Tax=Vitis vinifera TaxID=29760 RepID=D7TX18_VITVI